MTELARCKCQRCTIRGFTWPVVLITAGVLFLLDRSSFRYSFSQLWPVLLIVWGVVRFASAVSSAEGHTGPC